MKKGINNTKIRAHIKCLKSFPSQAKLPGRGRRAVSEDDSNEEESTASRLVKDTHSGVEKVCLSKKGYKHYENSSTHEVLKELSVAGQACWQRS